ncbi:methyltransferase domain-containing protein [Cytophagaceae bacterium 50C-KIRBA]|uniref:Methyltransferase domain-containing protein n=1 Tax=Aquirufa beregesia TaxID=2516556 RepID=A0ABX0F0J9_9BACT|nr:methyltransferase [Aquirufa beregesia]NGZ45402.1 methyltransferase domain-containing protein [Aquirufa beregesia]
MAESRSIFQFKQFQLAHGNPGLKISTEACLFGAWIPLGNVHHALDIGTGCGLLAHMLCQKAPGLQVDALEIHPDVAELAHQNAEHGPFKVQIKVFQGDIKTWTASQAYDLILCNPPFFTNHLAASDSSKQAAIHADHLSPDDLAQAIQHQLADSGNFAVLYPPYEMGLFLQTAEKRGIFANRLADIIPKPGAKVLRQMLWGSRQKSELLKEQIHIRDEQGDYHPDFQELLKPYYLIFP